MGLIGVLALLVMAGAKAVGTKQGGVRCISHLRQVGAAMLNYIADNNQTLRSFHGGNDVNEMWSRKLLYQGYLAPVTQGNENAILLHQIDAVGDLLRCPVGAIEETYRSDNLLARNNPKRWIWQAYGLGMYQSDFPINNTIVAGKSTGHFEVKVANIQQPSRYILFADSSGVGPNYYQTFRISRNKGEGGVCLRHNGRANAIFLDGHIEQLDAKAAKDLGVPEHSIHSPDQK